MTLQDFLAFTTIMIVGMAFGLTVIRYIINKLI